MVINYDLKRLNELLKNFHELTKTKIVVFNDELEKIAEYPVNDCEFCSLIRSDPGAETNCLQSDRHACQEAKVRGSLYSYKCHAGLNETVAPVKFGNIVIGYIMFGQVLLKSGKKKGLDHVLASCADYNIDFDSLKAAYSRQRPITARQVFAAAQILEACAGYLWLSSLVSLSEESLPRQIDEFIIANLASDLSSAVICNRFGISRSKLYKIAKENYGTGIDVFVRAERIRLAKNLLRTTELPVSRIAYQAGFNDYNYFIRVFKQHTGLTPKIFRRQSQI